MLWAVCWFLIGGYKMKRSEMFLALYNEFGHRLNSIELVNEILTFLESQGMRPPLNIDSEDFPFAYEWEPEDEKK
jgi:hypothetical protein